MRHIKHKVIHFLKHKKKFWIPGFLVVLAISGYMFFAKGGLNGTTQTGIVQRQNIEETVLSTGQVVSGLDLDLSFLGSGVVKEILVKEGDKVEKGQTLAYLEQSSARASLTTAQGSLAQARANYDKLLAGSAVENIKIYQDSVSLAKQDLDNAYKGSFNTLQFAYNSIFNAYSTIVNVRNRYFTAADFQGDVVKDARDSTNEIMKEVKTELDNITEYSLTNQNILDSIISKMILSLNTVYNNVSAVRLQADYGDNQPYYVQVSESDKASLDTVKSSVNTALANVISVQNSVSSAKIALQKAENQLLLIKAPPTQAEIDLARAQILSAQGQVDSAQAIFNNAIIKAPADGVVTHIDIKPGEYASSLTPVIVLQDVGDLHTEADVSEANIASLQLNQEVDYTFDALGPDRHFKGHILTINPSSTVISGIVNYKIKGSLEDVPGAKPGMTVNMTILVSKKDNVLAVPSTAVINKNNSYYVRIIDNPKTLDYHEVEVKTGLQADGGLIEILSGLNEGQSIITYMRQ